MLGDVDLRVLLDAGMEGWSILLFFAASCVFALLWAVFASIGSSSKWGLVQRVLFWLSAGSAMFAIAISAYNTHRWQRALIASMGSEYFHSQWGDAIEKIESTYLTVGLALLVVASFALIGSSIRAIRGRKEADRPPWFLSFTSAILGLSTAASILIRAHYAGNPNRSAAQAVWEVVQLVEDTAPILSTAKIVIVVIASLASLIVVAARTRHTIARASKHAWMPSALLGLGGLVIWIASRPMAYDGAHPLPFPKNAFSYYHCPIPLQTNPQKLPRTKTAGKRCTDLFSEDIIPLALIEVGSSGAMANGRPLEDPVHAFEYVNSMRLLRDAGNPPGHWSVLLIAAPASMSAEELGPWLGAVESSNQRYGVVMVHDQPAVMTATAGVIERSARCSCPRVVLDSRGTSLQGHTWGDIVRGAVERPTETPLVLDPGYSLNLDGGDFAIVKNQSLIQPKNIPQ